MKYSLTFLLMTTITLTISHNLSFGKATHNTQWNYLYKKKTIAVYQEKNKTNSYMAEGEIHENFFEVLAVSSDIERRSEWVPNLKYSSVVDGDLESKVILHEEFNLPWPVQNRDSIIECKIIKNYKNKELLIQYYRVEHPKVPIQKGIVRVPKASGQMHFKFIDEKTTHARYEIELDAGGALPQFVVNFFIKKAPIQALEGLVKQIKKTKGQYNSFLEKHKKISENLQ